MDRGNDMQVKVLVLGKKFTWHEISSTHKDIPVLLSLMGVLPTSDVGLLGLELKDGGKNA